MDMSAIIKEFSERLICIETKIDMLVKQTAEAQPRIAYLEKETERQRDSLTQAHKRLDAHDKRYYWLIGILVTIFIAGVSLVR